MRVRATLALTGLLGIAAAAPAPAHAADPPSTELGIRVREHLESGWYPYASPSKSRFRVQVAGTTASRELSILGLRVGELAVDVPLARGRFAERVQVAGGTCRVRVRSHGHRLVAVIRASAADEAGAIFGRASLERLQVDLSGAVGAFHGLLPASAVVDGATVPLVVGLAGRFKWKWWVSSPGADDEFTLSISAAAIMPSDRATRPVVLLTPPGPGRRWKGRISGLAFGTAAPPSLSYETSAGRVRTIDAPDSWGIDVGQAELQGPGVCALVQPEGPVFQRSFDVAVQSPPGPQTISIRADGPHGYSAQATRSYEMRAADPPTQLDSDFHVLEIRAGGTLWSWGQNLAGEIGDGTYRSPISPVPLSMPREVVSIGAGGTFSIAADAAGTAWIWGDIGDVDGTRPQPIEKLSDIVAVSAAYEDALALEADGGVWLWTYDRPHISRVTGAPPMTAIADGENFALALDRRGRVWDLFATDSGIPPRPAVVEDIPPMIAIAAAYDALCLDEEGGVWAWGVTPEKVALPGPATAISAGYDHYDLALLADGTVWSWVLDASGDEQRAEAVRVRDLDGITLIVASTGDPSFAVDSDGAVWSWESFEIAAGTEYPELAPRAFEPGHLPPERAIFTKPPRRVAGRPRRH